MRPMRRLARGPVAVCFALVGVLVVGLAQPAAAAQYSGSIVQWNLSGYSLYKGSTTPADKLVRNVTARSSLPQVIVANEVCSTQYNYLVAKLTTSTYGYAAAANWSIPNLDPARCPSFGNVVLWRGTGPQPVVDRITYPDSTQINGAATSEKRNMICVRFQARPVAVGGPSPMLQACGTHLHQDDAWAARQLEVAKSHVDAENAAGTPTLLIGDLNVVPAVSALDPWYSGYREADGTNRTSPRRTTTSGAKLDYGFVPASTAAITAPAKIEFQLFSSDHAIYTTSFALTG